LLARSQFLAHLFKMKTQNGQAWGFDLIIAVMIFLVGVILIYFYTINYPGQEQDEIQNLQYEGQILSETLLSDGSPVNWNMTNVLRPGILSNGKINQTKLAMFKDLSNATNYQFARALFRMRNNYYIEFQNPIIISGQSTSLIGLNRTNEKNLVKTTRVVIYENNLTTFKFYIWN
jgi:hypothetical protein